jgi:hypothetical protein
MLHQRYPVVRPELAGMMLHLPPGQWWSEDGWLHVEIDEIGQPPPTDRDLPEGWVWVTGTLHVDGEPGELCSVPVLESALEGARAGSKETERAGTSGRQMPGTQHEGGSSAAPAAADDDHGRRTAYAAVTANFEGDAVLVVKFIRELIQTPTEAASGLMALVHACGAMAELWASAVHEEPVKAWAKYAETVAWVVSQGPAHG